MTLRQKTVLILGGALAGLLIFLYGLLTALTQQSSFQFDTEAARQQMVLTLTLAVLASGLVLGALAWWWLDRQVLSRLAQLGQVFQRIHATGDLSQRAPAEGADEIAALSRTANAALEQWQATVTTLQQREAERGRQLAAIRDMGRAAVADLSFEPLLARVVEVIREHFACEGVAICLIEAGSGQPGEAVVIETTRPQWQPKGSRRRTGAPDVTGQALAAGAPKIVSTSPASGSPVATQAAFPLHAGPRTIGALELQSTRPDALTPADVATLQILADQIAVSLENGRLFSQQKRVLQLEELTLTLTNKIHQSLKPTTILESAALELGRVLGARRAVVKLFGEEPPPPPEARE